MIPSHCRCGVRCSRPDSKRPHSKVEEALELDECSTGTRHTAMRHCVAAYALRCADVLDRWSTRYRAGNDSEQRGGNRQHDHDNGPLREGV